MMKTQITMILAVAFAMLLSFSSCELFEDSSKDIGGDPSPMGEVGNNFSVTTIPGVSDGSAKVISRNGDVSKIEYTATISDPKLLSLVSAMPDVVVNGDKASVSREYRITTEGFQSVYPEGKLTIVDFKGKVGDTYSLKRNGQTIERKMTSKSETDDYSYGFMLIKVIKVEETGRNIPGVSKVEYIANHRWGMVGVVIHFEDGTNLPIGVFSDASND